MSTFSPPRLLRRGPRPLGPVVDGHRAMRPAAFVDLRAQRLRVADRADLGDIAAEGQARRPVDHGAGLAGGTGDLAHVVGPRKPPGREPAERAGADPADGL